MVLEKSPGITVEHLESETESKRIAERNSVVPCVKPVMRTPYAFTRWAALSSRSDLDECASMSKLLLKLVRDEDMMADALSKVTDRAKFLKCRAALLNL